MLPGSVQLVKGGLCTDGLATVGCCSVLSIRLLTSATLHTSCLITSSDIGSFKSFLAPCLKSGRSEMPHAAVNDMSGTRLVLFPSSVPSSPGAHDDRLWTWRVSSYKTDQKQE